MSGHRLPELFAHVAAEQEALASRPLDGLADKVIRAAWEGALPPLLPTPEGPSKRRWWPAIALSGGLGFAVVALFLVLSKPGKPTVQARVGQNPVEVTAGVTLQASEDAELPLAFSEGSRITFNPGARALLSKLTPRGAEVGLETGELVARINHLPEAAWQVAAGPYRVVVTGTRFLAGYQPLEKFLTVHLYEGSVIVHGPHLGNGMALVAGQLLEVREGSGVTVRQISAEAVSAESSRPVGAVFQHRPVIEPRPGVEAESAVAAPVPTATGAAAADGLPALPPSTDDGITLVAKPSAAAADRGPDWMALAERGRYEAALSAAEKSGFSDLCRRLPARKLLSLADVARFAGESDRTREAFESLVRRFPRDRFAADAVFGLGRLSTESGKPLDAVAWFERYLSAWPNEVLAEQAAGRLLELYPALGQKDAAVQTARLYLERYPSGVRRALAQRILAGRGAGDRR